MKHNWRQLAVIVGLRIVNVGIIDKSKTGTATTTKEPEKCEPFSVPKKNADRIHIEICILFTSMNIWVHAVDSVA